MVSIIAVRGEQHDRSAQLPVHLSQISRSALARNEQRTTGRRPPYVCAQAAGKNSCIACGKQTFCALSWNLKRHGCTPVLPGEPESRYSTILCPGRSHIRLGVQTRNVTHPLCCVLVVFFGQSFAPMKPLYMARFIQGTLCNSHYSPRTRGGGITSRKASGREEY